MTATRDTFLHASQSYAVFPVIARIIIHRLRAICECTHEIEVTTGKHISVVTMDGRYNVCLPRKVCPTCFAEWTPGVKDLLNYRYWPSTTSCQTLYRFDIFEAFAHMKISERAKLEADSFSEFKEKQWVCDVCDHSNQTRQRKTKKIRDLKKKLREKILQYNSAEEDKIDEELACSLTEDYILPWERLGDGHSFRLKQTVFDQIMLLKRLEEEQRILVKEMSQHIKSLQKEIKGVEKRKKNIGMGSMSNSKHYFLIKAQGEDYTPRIRKDSEVDHGRQTLDEQHNNLAKGHENKDTFFKTTQRHQIGPFEIPKTPGDPQSLNMRQILHHYWARWACWKKYQPLDHIREYFGEKIALYFAWLGFYTGWLLPAAVVGFIVFLFGIWLMVTDVAAEELCSSGDIFVMCPLCNICSYWNLSSICYTYKAGLLFDNGGTVFFSIFMSLWAVTFLEYWKRTCSILSHRWDCSEFEEIEERPRPEFTALAPMTVRNPVTGAEEPYFPETQRLSRTLTGNMVIILMISIVLIFLIAIILYRTILSIIIYRSQNAFFIFSAGRIASLTGSMLNLLVILLLSRLYTYLAQILTRWEMHRTQTKYEDAFILKVFIFQFVNFYSSPVYIAFFKGRFVGYPGNYNTLLGIRNEDVSVYIVGKQILYLFT
ncbi:anoctamin-7 [Labeo rohita]|uniref:Anoctamin n=1 Tax=Labeo rohita TaxID=84645 RepID=A0A498MR34_LABRO|nr:anoctamin-7 [Labeo rohita]